MYPYLKSLQVMVATALALTVIPSEPESLGMNPNQGFSLEIVPINIPLPGRNDVYFNILSSMENIARDEYESVFRNRIFRNHKYPAVKIICLNVEDQPPLLTKVVLSALYQTYLELSSVAVRSGVWESCRTTIFLGAEKMHIGSCFVMRSDDDYQKFLSLTATDISSSNISSLVAPTPNTSMNDTMFLDSEQDNTPSPETEIRCYIDVRFIRPRVEIGIDNMFPFILKTMIIGAKHTQGEPIAGIELRDRHFLISLLITGVRPTPSQRAPFFEKLYFLTGMRTLARQLVDEGRFDELKLRIYGVNGTGAVVNVGAGDIRKI